MTNRQSNEALDKHFGRNLNMLRGIKGFTQDQLAEKIGVTFQQVQKYENGSNRIAASTAVRICEALGVKLNQLLSVENQWEGMDDIDLQSMRKAALLKELQPDVRQAMFSLINILSKDAK
jgi:transcriptional regulator with XRE-family HTH domain